MSPTQKKLSSRRWTHYISSIVLGLNDAVVEMTGALAGFSIALHNNRLVILAAITTGVAATLSMAAAEFLAKEADDLTASSYVSAICTGVAYLLTVAILLTPFFLIENTLIALLFCLLLAALVIFLFTFCIAQIKKTAFLPNFKKMLYVSFSVAAIAFSISWAANFFWGVDF